MSTNWGYVCLTHDPAIESEHWFNHGDDLLTAVCLIERAGKWPEVEVGTWTEPADVMHNGWGTASPVYWLRAHPKCKIALRNEYGDTKHLPLLWTPETLLGTYRTRISEMRELIALIESATTSTRSRPEETS